MLRLSQRAKSFNPGRGVYRSSYKNARRLAATETNIAYRTADYLRWQQMDFVVGIEILLSNNHTVRLQAGERTDDPTQQRKDGSPKANAVRPLTDICDELQGRYPKDFKFTGWHPHCRCRAISILKTEEEMARDTERILRGEEPLPFETSANAVRSMPKGFNDWTEKNVSRIKKARKNGTLPYFLRDNEGKIIYSKQPNKFIIHEIKEALAQINTPHQKNAYVTFDPFSPILIDILSKCRDKKRKLQLFSELLEDEAFSTLSNIEKYPAKTVLHPLHKIKDRYWKQTSQMAFDLNKAKRDVIFLPEYESTTSADALVLFNGKPRIADFKYCKSTKWNTLQLNLSEGFNQAGLIVLKLDRMDAGQFRETIEYMKRKQLPLGDIILINRHGKVMELHHKSLMSNNYRNKIKGFL